MVLGLIVGFLVGAAAAWLAFFLWSSQRSAQTVATIDRIVAGDDFPPDHPSEAPIQAAVRRLDSARRSDLASASAELRLRERAINSLAEGVVLLTPDMHVVYANAEAHEILGNAVSGPALRHTVLTEMARSAGETGFSESSFEDPLGKRSFAASARLVEDDRNVVIVVRDDTEARRLSAVRRDFVADASHELKTPVASIQAAIETVTLALADGDVEAAARFSTTVQTSAQRLSTLVGDLLDLSRLEDVRERSEVIDLASLARAEIDRYSGAQPRPTLQTPQHPLAVHGSAADLRLALSNLLANAVRYTEADGAVMVRLIVEEAWVTIEVVDTGSGIPSKDISRVFERFYRVDAARSRATGGTGLGLSIVRHIMEQHGGTVSVASVLGEGSTFRMRLPLADVVV